MQTRIESIWGTLGDQVGDETVDLVLTSPPYPMIEMWDDIFASQDGAIGDALAGADGVLACELMHGLLDRVWDQVFRVLKPGGIACINIGDATRSLNGQFRLFSNHARILQHLGRLGLVTLPDILWRKPSNAPTKFMGSGMLPVGAYVTYEHEYILIVRKGDRRTFTTPRDKARRRESAFFWEERNLWFSDVWFDVRGAGQNMVAEETRQRSAAFPFKLAYRLICMFSLKGDMVLDPFAGTGTTLAAAVATARNAIGVEIDTGLGEVVAEAISASADYANDYNLARLRHHAAFIAEREEEGHTAKYANRHYGFPVVTAQEQDLLINEVIEIRRSGEYAFEVRYADGSQTRFD